jgi:Tol biopolymer transport system component
MQPAGARLGPYEIEAALGAGGMGEVYRARDTRLGRIVALKVLAARLGAVPGQRERFSREARAISSVEHSNICPLYDVGTEGGIDYIVMQFVEGETLADRIARGPVPLPQALALARQVALGLEAAHEGGIVHRDLKPANIQVARDGQVKLLDFGLARILDDGSAPLDESTAPTAQAPTAAGRVVGTSYYMSPEQARGERVDRRTDVWAFGCVLYEMLSGRRAFDGHSLPDVMAALVGSEPDWKRLPAATPARVRDVLRLCLRKDASERLRDVGDARLQLESAGSDEPALMAAGGGRASLAARLIPWATAAAAVAALGFVLARPRGPREGPAPEMRFSAVTNVSGVETQPSFSPDGRSIAYVSNHGGQWDVYVGLVTGGSPVRVTNEPSLELRPRWSPDGSRIAFGRLNEKGLVDLWVTSALGGEARRIVPNARQPAWSPDGRQIAYSSGGILWVCEASGANPRAVTSAELPLGHYQPAFSRDGRSLVFVRRRDGPYGELAVADVATGSVRELTHDGALALSPVWSPDGRFVYFSSSRGGTLNVWKIAVDTGEPRRITAGVGDDAEIDLSADGKRLVFSSYHANVNLAEVRIQGKTKAALQWLTTDSARGEHAPSYSPDGREIAYMSSHSGSEHESIWVMNADGSQPVRIVEDDRISVLPRWTPDSRDLVYVSRAPGMAAWKAELRRLRVTGGAPEVLPISPWVAAWGDVASDGRLLVRTSASAAELIDTRSSQRVTVPDVPTEPALSPDGKSVSYIVRPEEGDERAGLWAGPLEGQRLRVLPGWVAWSAWARSGELLALAARPDLTSDLWRVSRDGRKSLVLQGVPLLFRHQIELISITRFDVHPDGSRIAMEALESLEADISMIENVP